MHPGPSKPPVGKPKPTPAPYYGDEYGEGPTVRDGTAQVIMGCDPGQYGALAKVLVDGERIELLDILDMPTFSVGSWVLVDGDEVLRFFNRDPLPDRVILEQVDARPTDGKAGGAAFARAVGGLASVLFMIGCPVRTVTPSVWKRRASLLGSKGESRSAAKKRSLDKARGVFGAEASTRWLKLVKNADRAEAALIALDKDR